MVLSLLGLSACGITNGKAKEAAKDYIEDKYGQDAKVVKIDKNYNLTGAGGGAFPTGIESDESYNIIMEMDGHKFDVCLIGDGDEYIGYDNYEEELIKSDMIEDIESNLLINCEDIFLSYSQLYGKYGDNMLHESYLDLSSIYENGKFAVIVATYDAIDPDYVEQYAAKFYVEDEKCTRRIEILQYKDEIPELGFSSFYEVTDSQYVLDWYTISKGDVEHHE